MLTSPAALAALLPLLAATSASALPSPGFQGQLPFLTSNGASKIGGHLDLQGTEIINLEKYTIGQILNYTLHKHREEHEHDEATKEIAGILDDYPHHPPLVKLAWVVNRTEEIKSYLSDESVSITLFAPDDEALTPPHHDGDEHGHHAFNKQQDDDLAAGPPAHHPLYRYTDDASFSALTKDHGGDSDDDDDDKERERRRKFFFDKVVPAVLRYHISPTSKLFFNEIQDKQTIGTALNQTRDTGVAWRIRSAPRFEIFPAPPKYTVNLNFYARIRNGPALLAKNGIVHLISAPLLPPLTPLDQLLAFPEPFSTLTSAVQQTELDSALAPWLHHHHHEEKKEDEQQSFTELLKNAADEPSAVAMAVLEEIIDEAKAKAKAGVAGLPSKDDFKAFPFTIFAPTNRAFSKIPFGIRTFLFSPFGKQYLKKLLEFHVIPQQIFHTDYYLNATRGASSSDNGAEVASTSTVSSVGLEHLFDHARFEPTSLGDAAGFPMPHFPGRGRGGNDGNDKPKFGGGGDEKHWKVEIKDYEFPTLLGSAKNESLAVKTYAYRLFGKGPLVRRIAVGHVGQEEKELSSVYISDGVAWGGAVHVIGSLIRPPFGDHGDHGHDGPGHGGPGHHGPPGHGPPGHHHDHDHHHGRAFAHGPLGDDLEYFQSLWA